MFNILEDHTPDELADGNEIDDHMYNG